MLPDFFKRENRKPSSKESIEFQKAVERYVDHFGYNDIMTEPGGSYTIKELPGIIDECIAQNKNIWEYMGEEYDPDCDY